MLPRSLAPDPYYHSDCILIFLLLSLARVCVSADLFVGGGFGKIRFLQNVGTKYRPEWRLNVTHNPLKHVDVGWLSAPTFGDFDKDGDMDVLIGQDKDLQGM